jgi:plasmid stability protein
MRVAPKHFRWRQNGANVRRLPSVQIKNVPEDVHRILRTRAAAAGQSLQEYLLARLVQDAREQPLDELLDRIGERSGGSIGFAAAVDILREERDGR